MPGRKDDFWGDRRSGGQELRNGRMWPSLSRMGRNPGRQQQAGGCPGAGWLGPVDELRPAVVVGGIPVELSEVPTGAMAGEGSRIPHLGRTEACSQHHMRGSLLQECRSRWTQVCQPVFGGHEALGRRLQVFVEDLEGRTAGGMSAGVLASSGTGKGAGKEPAPAPTSPTPAACPRASADQPCRPQAEAGARLLFWRRRPWC